MEINGSMVEKNNRIEYSQESVLESDWSLRSHGITFHYWYSVNDIMTILEYFRSIYLKFSLVEILSSNALIDVADLYSSYRINVSMIFLANPYSIENLEINFMDDLGRLYIEWGEFPRQFILVLIANSHWRVVRMFFYVESIDILWDDPYGGNCFPYMIKEMMMNIVGSAYMHFYNKNVVINQITKSLDQQGLGENGWDCGPIALQNVEDYLINFNILNENFNYYTIVDVISYNNNHMIHTIRKKHIIIALKDDYTGQDIIFETNTIVNNKKGEKNELPNINSSNNNQVNETKEMEYGELKSLKEIEGINKKGDNWLFGTLNVRTLGVDIQNAEDANLGRLPIFANYFLANNIKIIAMQETRIPGNKICTKHNYVTHFSGNLSVDIKPREYGVGIAVHNDWKTFIKEVNPINNRIMWIYLENLELEFKYVIFSVYGPTNPTDIEVKEVFWLQLNKAYSEVKRLYPLAVILFGGDFNARVGASLDVNDIDYDILGSKLSITDRNENGSELLLFCHNNKMAVVNSFFSYYNGTGTWPPADFKYTLDHILMDKNIFRNIVISAGVKDNYALPTDHRITIANIKQHNVNNIKKPVSKSRKRKSEGKRDVSLLITNEEVSKRYRLNMVKELDMPNLIDQIKNDGCVNVENVIDKLSKSIFKLNDYHLPKIKNKKHANWFDLSYPLVKDTLRKRDIAHKLWSKNRSNNSLYENFIQLRKKVDCILCQQQTEYWLNIGQSLKQSFDSSRDITFYKILKSSLGLNIKHYKSGKCSFDNSIFDKNGVELFDKKEIKLRWKEYYMELLSMEDEIVSNIDDFLSEVNYTTQMIFDEPFTNDEIISAMNNCSFNKAVGIDGIPIECIRVMIDVKTKKETPVNNYVALITLIINEILNTGHVPDKWKNVIIAIVPKPGDSRDCNNSRGISLIAHIGKVLESCIHYRVKKIFESVVKGINETQFGSMNGKGIDDALLVSSMITSSALERGVNLYKCYIDLKKAYDRVSRKILYKILHNKGVPPKLLRLIKAIHDGIIAQVRVDGELCDGFELKMGVKQGGVLSGLFWNIYMAAIIEEVHKRFKLRNIKGVILKYRIDGNVIELNDLIDTLCLEKQIFEILYVDDWVIFATTMKELQEMVVIINEVTKVFLQEVAINKTKYMRVVRFHEDETDLIDLFINDKKIEEVKLFKYLGITESDNGKLNTEIEKRMMCMRLAFEKYKQRIFKNRYLSLQNKLILFTTFVSTVGLYGSATWCINDLLINKLEALHFRMLKSIVPGVTTNSSYEDVIMFAANMNVPIITIDCLIKKRMLRFLGHVQRMNDNSLQKIVIHSRMINGTQCKGAPPTSYRQSICKAIKSFGIDTDNWMELAKYRSRWYKKIEDDGIKFCMKHWLTDRVNKRKLRYEKYEFERINFNKQITEVIDANGFEGELLQPINTNVNLSLYCEIEIDNSLIIDKFDNTMYQDHAIDDVILDEDREYYYNVANNECLDNNNKQQNNLNVNSVSVSTSVETSCVNSRWLDDKINAYKDVYDLWEKAWSRKNSNKGEANGNVGTNSVDIDCVLDIPKVNTVNIPIHVKKIIPIICNSDYGYVRQFSHTYSKTSSRFKKVEVRFNTKRHSWSKSNRKIGGVLLNNCIINPIDIGNNSSTLINNNDDGNMDSAEKTFDNLEKNIDKAVEINNNDEETNNNMFIMINRSFDVGISPIKKKNRKEVVKSCNQENELNNETLNIDNETNDYDDRIHSEVVISPIKPKRNRGGKNRFKNRRPTLTSSLLTTNNDTCGEVFMSTELNHNNISSNNTHTDTTVSSGELNTENVLDI